MFVRFLLFGIRVSSHFSGRESAKREERGASVCKWRDKDTEEVPDWHPSFSTELHVLIEHFSL
jgi:hypothetical protein